MPTDAALRYLRPLGGAGMLHLVEEPVDGGEVASLRLWAETCLTDEVEVGLPIVPDPSQERGQGHPSEPVSARFRHADGQPGVCGRRVSSTYEQEVLILQGPDQSLRDSPDGRAPGLIQAHMWGAAVHLHVAQ